MPVQRFLVAAMVLALTAVCPVHAAQVGAVDVTLRGAALDEATRKALVENARSALSVAQAIDKDMSDRRLDYLISEAQDEARIALQPFGYYSPQIEVSRDQVDGATRVSISIDPGQPVTVRDAHVAITGEGGQDSVLAQAVAQFRPGPGDVFEHTIYETSKTRINRSLGRRGYFDAQYASRRVEVTRADRAADIDLVWDSGIRYDIGAATFEQTPAPIIRDPLLQQLVHWRPGSAYQQKYLERLRESLARLDYFSAIDIEPQPEQAVDGDVPVRVTLIPAKPNIYTAALSYGTDSGAGIRLGWQSRYLNAYGHKAAVQLDYAQKRKILTLRYRIPAFAWVDGWYTFSAQAVDEQTDYIDSRRIELIASRSGQFNRYWNITASLHALRERWAYATADPTAPVDYRYATFTYPSLFGEYVDADSLIFPRDALAGSILLRGGLEGAGSEASFAQTRLTAHWYQSLGTSNRLIVRGEIGHTFTGAPLELPPSLRFYAGGNDSIRGYGYREVGPRITTPAGEFSLGAKNVVTASVEFEHYFNDSWGAAVFVDTGSAFNDQPQWRTGVGVGLRWRSPVGPLRVDIAHGLDDPDSAFQIYLNIGAQL